MLKRDFIMIQIEELAKVVLQIIMNRNTNAARHTPELIQTIYSSLKLDRPTPYDGPARRACPSTRQ